MHLVMESMWRVALLDIEATLRHVCNKILSDSTVSMTARKARARGLVTMGRIFMQYGSEDAMRKMDFKKHFEQVGERLAEKHAGGPP